MSKPTLDSFRTQIGTANRGELFLDKDGNVAKRNCNFFRQIFPLRTDSAQREAVRKALYEVLMDDGVTANESVRNQLCEKLGVDKDGNWYEGKLAERLDRRLVKDILSIVDKAKQTTLEGELSLNGYNHEDIQQMLGTLDEQHLNNYKSQYERHVACDQDNADTRAQKDFQRNSLVSKIWLEHDNAVDLDKFKAIGANVDNMYAEALKRKFIDPKADIDKTCCKMVFGEILRQFDRDQPRNVDKESREYAEKLRNAFCDAVDVCKSLLRVLPAVQQGYERGLDEFCGKIKDSNTQEIVQRRRDNADKFLGGRDKVLEGKLKQLLNFCSDTNEVVGKWSKYVGFEFEDNKKTLEIIFGVGQSENLTEAELIERTLQDCVANEVELKLPYLELDELFVKESFEDNVKKLGLKYSDCVDVLKAELYSNLEQSILPRVNEGKMNHLEVIEEVRQTVSKQLDAAFEVTRNITLKQLGYEALKFNNNRENLSRIFGSDSWLESYKYDVPAQICVMDEYEIRMMAALTGRDTVKSAVASLSEIIGKKISEGVALLLDGKNNFKNYPTLAHVLEDAKPEQYFYWMSFNDAQGYIQRYNEEFDAEFCEIAKKTIADFRYNPENDIEQLKLAHSVKIGQEMNELLADFKEAFEREVSKENRNKHKETAKTFFEEQFSAAEKCNPPGDSGAEERAENNFEPLLKFVSNWFNDLAIRKFEKAAEDSIEVCRPSFGKEARSYEQTVANSMVLIARELGKPFSEIRGQIIEVVGVLQPIVKEISSRFSLSVGDIWNGFPGELGDKYKYDLRTMVGEFCEKMVLDKDSPKTSDSVIKLEFKSKITELFENLAEDLQKTRDEYQHKRAEGVIERVSVHFEDLQKQSQSGFDIRYLLQNAKVLKSIDDYFISSETDQNRNAAVVHDSNSVDVNGAVISSVARIAKIYDEMSGRLRADYSQLSNSNQEELKKKGPLDTWLRDKFGKRAIENWAVDSFKMVLFNPDGEKFVSASLEKLIEETKTDKEYLAVVSQEYERAKNIIADNFVERMSDNWGDLYSIGNKTQKTFNFFTTTVREVFLQSDKGTNNVSEIGLKLKQLENRYDKIFKAFGVLNVNYERLFAKVDNEITRKLSEIDASLVRDLREIEYEPLKAQFAELMQSGIAKILENLMYHAENADYETLSSEIVKNLENENASVINSIVESIKYFAERFGEIKPLILEGVVVHLGDGKKYTRITDDKQFQLKLIAKISQEMTLGKIFAQIEDKRMALKDQPIFLLGIKYFEGRVNRIVSALEAADAAIKEQKIATNPLVSPEAIAKIQKKCLDELKDDLLTGNETAALQKCLAALKNFEANVKRFSERLDIVKKLIKSRTDQLAILNDLSMDDITSSRIFTKKVSETLIGLNDSKREHVTPWEMYIPEQVYNEFNRLNSTMLYASLYAAWRHDFNEGADSYQRQAVGKLISNLKEQLLAGKDIEMLVQNVQGYINGINKLKFEKDAVQRKFKAGILADIQKRLMSGDDITDSPNYGAFYANWIDGLTTITIIDQHQFAGNLISDLKVNLLAGENIEKALASFEKELG